MKNILICGSIAYDTIMVFEDYFKHHILPDQIHKLSVSFYVPKLKKNFGGTAGNIAYNLRLLNSSPIIIATVGEDFQLYSDRLSKLEIIQDYIRVIPGTHTAQAFITTDLDDNQITAFHPGAMTQSHKNTISTVSESIGLAIIAPDGKDGMINHAKECLDANIPILFDPGQGLPMFNQEELITFIKQASYISVNDYEAQVLSNTSKLSIQEISKKVTALIITKGSEGSLIYTDNKILKIDPFPADNIIDPTGCGDAYRSGLTYGIINELSWEKTGWLASIMGGIKIQSAGGQNHTPSINDIESYFGEKLD